MEKEHLEYFKRKLEGLRDTARKSAGNIKNGLRVPLKESAHELSLYDNHPGDVGNATFERELDLGLMLINEDRLSMIEEALRAIDSGTYGLCQSCGREIGFDRLEAIPYTLLCRDCKKEFEFNHI
ncbi:MAG: TraR/DksA C4-type zinc finger protein [Peptococcaceae bacterium]|jgi:RNA polymerase-binding protein DksA|nr:TraR/DksA C4-type zinc finger protein [Peptococcaceae bacterium]MDH7526073.1 TraR/DksA C4-type zinc finger protein [Peptococcaceae bacterium]